MHRSYYKDSKESYIVWDFLNIQNTPIKRRPACLQTRGWRHLSPVHAREPFAQLNQPEVRMVEEESQSQDLYNVSASENSICSLVRCLQRTEGDCPMQTGFCSHQPTLIPRLAIIAPALFYTNRTTCGLFGSIPVLASKNMESKRKRLPTRRSAGTGVLLKTDIYIYICIGTVTCCWLTGQIRPCVRSRTIPSCFLAPRVELGSEVLQLVPLLLGWRPSLFNYVL